LSDDWGYNGAACLWSSVYDGLSPAQIQQVERVISRKRLPKGTTIFGVGDAPDEVVIVVDGRIRCYVLSESGESYTVALYGHDRLTGLMSALMEVPRMATAETIETVSLDLISRRSLRQLMIEVPEFGANVAKLAAAMASDLIWALQERALRSATERLCSGLKD
jgi:CRP-like cAMP-binding protein